MQPAQVLTAGAHRSSRLRPPLMPHPLPSSHPQVSYMILQRVSPVTHSIGNSVKRVVVIASSILVFRNPVTQQVTAAWQLVCQLFCGLLIPLGVPNPATVQRARPGACGKRCLGHARALLGGVVVLGAAAWRRHCMCAHATAPLAVICLSSTTHWAPPPRPPH